MYNSQSIPLNRIIAWKDPISKGTNPLIGHSIVLKTFENENVRTLQEEEDDGIEFVQNQYISPISNSYHFSGERLIACAVLGIVPSC